MYRELSDFFSVFKKYQHIVDRHRIGKRFYDMYIFHIITDVSCIYEEWRYEVLKSKLPRRVLTNHQDLMESVQQIPNKTNIKFMSSEKDGMKMTARLSIGKFRRLHPGSGQTLVSGVDLKRWGGCRAGQG